VLRGQSPSTHLFHPYHHLRKRTPSFSPSFSTPKYWPREAQPDDHWVMNRPPAVAIDFGTAADPDVSSSFEFEEVGYPDQYHHHHQHQYHDQRHSEEALPLYSMSVSEEKARRRVRVAAGGAQGAEGDSGFVAGEKEQFEYQEEDDKGKGGVYRPYNGQRISSGRVPLQHLPPPTSIVSTFVRSLASR
jgi:hypothetical protein